MRIVHWFATVLLALGGLGLAACGDDGSGGNDGTLDVGDCFDSDEGQRTPVDCGEPHRAQVVGIVGPGPSGEIDSRECATEALNFLAAPPSFFDADAEGDAAEGTAGIDIDFNRISEELELPGLTVSGDLVGNDVTGETTGAPAFLCYFVLEDEGQLTQDLEGALEDA